MTPSFPKPLAAAFAALCIVLASCGDDESNPVAVDSPCDDTGTACVTVTLNAAEMTHLATYDSGDDETSHQLSWDVGSDVIRGYEPGARIIVTVYFNPPLEVRYDHPDHRFLLGAGVVIGCHNRFATPTTGLESDNWVTTESLAYCKGECTTGASGLDLAANFGPMAAGQRLSRLAFDFIVPDTYTSGGAGGTAILPGDLDVIRLSVSTLVDGDVTGAPPVWQGVYEPAVVLDQD